MVESISDYILGCGAGGAFYGAAIAGKKQINGKFIGKLVNNTSVKENSFFKPYVFESFEKSGLKEAGIKLVHLDNTNKEKVLKEFWGSFTKTKDLDKALHAVADGRFVLFHNSSKNIFINTDKVSLAAFHEMGHAAICNGKNKFLKILTQSQHTLAKFPLLFFAVGLLKNKKPEGEKPKNALDDTTTLIKNNAGKLSFLVLLPKIIDEGFASIKGAEFAKKVLPPEKMKVLNKTNFLAWSTYVISALAISTGIALGIKLRDMIVHRNNLEKQELNFLDKKTSFI